MKLSDKWTVVGRNGDYVLTETYPTVNPKNGKATEGKRVTYHPTLDQIAKKIAKVESEDCISVENLQQVIEKLEEITVSVRGSMLEVDTAPESMS